MAMKEPIDIEDMRKRHANSIRNTATGRALAAALNELEELKNLNEGNQNENRTDRNSDPLPSSDR
jgi:DNA-binding IclR family transcriptional regulator